MCLFEFLRQIDYKDILVIESSFSAGAGTPFNDGLGTTLIDKEFIKNAKLPYLIIVSGDSMHPTIQVNDHAIVDFDNKGKTGDIVAVQLNGELLIKEFRETRNGYVLHSHNEAYNDIEIKDSDNFFVFGKVVRYIRNL